MASLLTRGALCQISAGEEVYEPILQILDRQAIPGSQDYRLLISDSTYMTRMVRLSPALNHLVEDHKIPKYTIIKVKKLNQHQHSERRRVITILDLEILIPGNQFGRRIEDPMMMAL